MLRYVLGWLIHNKSESEVHFIDVLNSEMKSEVSTAVLLGIQVF
jgi:hypothetical protein